MNYSNHIFVKKELDLDKALKILKEVIKGKETFSFFDSLFDLH
jgi:hypothetical protein